MATLEPVRTATDIGSDEFWLHPEAGSDGRMVIKDSAGRIMRGVRAIKFSSGLDQANEMTVTFLCGVDGAMTNQAKMK